MAEGWLPVLTLGAALGCGLVGGVFFAFSTFVMPGLARLPPAAGVAAMQSINVAAVTPAFMTALFGTGGLCAAVAIASLAHWEAPLAGWRLAAGLTYIAGAIVVTIAFNVPLNDALAAVAPDSPEAAALWAGYLDRWTRWNHVRTVASLAAAALLTSVLTR